MAQGSSNFSDVKGSSGYSENGDWVGDNTTKQVPSNLPLSNSTTGKLITKLSSPDTAAGEEKKERLRVIRPRSAAALYSSTNTKRYTLDRGPIAKRRLLTSGFNSAETRAKNGELGTVDVASELKELQSKDGGFSQFFLTSINFGLSEKIQILNTFGDGEVTYYFGRNPMAIQLTGILFDSVDQDWFAKFVTLYQGVLRGTKLAANYELLELTLPNMTLVGSISDVNFGQAADRDTDIQFSMTFVAKTLIPTSAVKLSSGVKNAAASLWGLNIGRKGVSKAIMSIGGFSDSSSGGGFLQTIGGIAGAIGSAVKTIDNTINVFRRSIFAPVYGILGVITKIVSSSTGALNKLISSLTSPVIGILKDINKVFGQAVAIASMVENSISGILSLPSKTINGVWAQLRQLKSTAGILSRIPENLSQTFQYNFRSGKIKPGAAILSSGKRRIKSKAALLKSGPRYSHVSSGVLVL